jgi:predicted transcriptional regulator
MTEFTHEAGVIDPVQSAKLTAEIVAAYVANHDLSRAALSELISSVHRALQEIAKPAPPPVEEPTTVDHALMRGLVTAGPVMRRGASSV